MEPRPAGAHPPLPRLDLPHRLAGAAGFDLAAEEASGRLDRRIRQVIGDRDYEIVWKSVYRFHSRLVDRMRVRSGTMRVPLCWPVLRRYVLYFPAEEAGTPADVALLEEIRDLLATRGGAV